MSVQPSESDPKAPKPRPVTIRVNNKSVELPDREATGGAIKAAAGVPADFKLYGPDGDEIADDQILKIHNNERFTAISGQDVS